MSETRSTPNDTFRTCSPGVPDDCQREGSWECSFARPSGPHRNGPWRAELYSTFILKEDREYAGVMPTLLLTQGWA